MKHTLILRSPEIANRAGEILSTLVRGDELHEVLIRPHKKERSVAQNSILWLWNTILGAELGESKEEIHERNKERFLVPIYERDDLDYAAMIEAVRNVYRQGLQQDALFLRKRIVALTSTTKATTAQMAEFLTEIERDAHRLGIILPRPEDLYQISMGRAA